ncbi:MAG: biotin transporter BioY [Actinobacteria bacterium]|nr:biotin transporter BioY [Actinomycetota bacterium]
MRLPWLAWSAGLTLEQTLAKGLLPFLVGDAVKLALAACALPAAWRLAHRR